MGKALTRSRHPNLTAARALQRAVREAGADESTLALTTLAVSLAGALDAAWDGHQPGYVVARFTSAYLGTLELLTRVFKPPETDAWSDLLRSLSTPSSGAPAPEEELQLRR